VESRKDKIRETSLGGGMAPFRMEVKQANRKRKRTAHVAAARPDNFGGDEDDDNTASLRHHQQQQHQQQVQAQAKTASVGLVNAGDSPSAANRNTKQQEGGSRSAAVSVSSSASSAQKQPPKQREKIQQPDGWRVKLYRLNTDGSWDDCGTGRVLCLYRPAMAKANASSPMPRNSANNAVGGFSGADAPSSPQHNAALDAWICQELGEPTLCMHAELVNESTQPRILLRTRILLRDAYQRQGDNIITWCEPYYDGNASNNHDSSNSNSNNNSSSGNCSNNSTSGGVDLALSFQDNAGCLDIWRQITHVQRRAAELYQKNQQQQASAQPHGQTHHQGDGQQQQQYHQHHADMDDAHQKAMKQAAQQNGGHQLLHHSDHDAGSMASNSGTVADVAQKVAAEHHAELERKQQHEMWVSMAGAVQHNSHHGSYGDGDDGGGPLSQQHHPNQPQHNAHHVHHRRGSNANNNNNNANKQQQQQHPGDNSQQQQLPFESEDGRAGGEMSGYNSSGGGASSPNHQEQASSANNQNNAILSLQLPSPPTLANLEEIADTIARVQVSFSRF
jgi:hypothetical protein